ncbi:hypothetical protein E2C01_018601 [Portunus trituberculatus]|uniref:Uncharacterized protein n=1 Tax=Portunus trituberculatus TaxID=210409 RepID=A0A5B7DW26_PORTR|nr:hypothetical protein [Portunus trituberculatus]
MPSLHHHGRHPVVYLSLGSLRLNSVVFPEPPQSSWSHHIGATVQQYIIENETIQNKVILSSAHLRQGAS